MGYFRFRDLGLVGLKWICQETITSIPPNQFRRDHPWTRFVLLDSSAGPVPSQAKVTHSLMLSLKKKSNTCRSTETSTDDVLLCLAGQVDKWVDLVAYPLGDQFTH